MCVLFSEFHNWLTVTVLLSGRFRFVENLSARCCSTIHADMFSTIPNRTDLYHTTEQHHDDRPTAEQNSYVYTLMK